MNGSDRDELNRPLGAPPPVAAANAAPSQPSRAGRSLIALTLGGVMALLGGAGVWFAQRHENERIRNDVAALIERQAATPAAPASPAPGAPAGPVVEGTDPAPTGSTGPSGLNPGVRATGKEIEIASGVRVVRAGDGEPEDRETPGAMVIKVPQAATITLAPAPDRRLTENGKHGVLPRRGADGASAMNIYARPVATPASLSSSAPRIAIMVGGMGLSQNATRAAISRLPPEVTLGFAPYGQGLAGQVAYARSRGHEVILQAPMEAIGIGDAPGPRMLQSSDGPAQTLDNLHWLMSRFHGYAGVANFLGARFLGDAKALAPVINEISNRGLFFFDDGTSPGSLARNLSATLSAPFVRADVVIDAQRDAKSIEAALNRLEALARAKGSAAGAASGLPDVVSRVAAFARALERRGIALVPVSALAERPAAAARAP